jgi:dihydrolipoamide dehydrogenase
MTNKNYDVAVLGSGPGGYVAAIKSAQLGLKTVIIEKENLGGVCLNWGCIPTKALLRSAEIMRYMKNSGEYGIKCSKPQIDWDNIIARSRKIAGQLAQGIEHLMQKNNIDVVNGYGRFLNNNNIEVTQGKKKETVTAKNIIIATGARAKFLKGLAPSDSPLIHGYREALTMPKQPKNLLVIGSGAIGVEFASFLNEMGTKATILEIADRIMINEDAEISAHMQDSLEKQGINVYTSANIDKFTLSKQSADFVFSDKKNKTIKQSFDAVISAVGVHANIDDIGLEKTNIQLVDKKYIKTFQYSQTDEANIYAIGDVTAPPWLAHKASREAILAAEAIAGKKPSSNLQNNNIPSCTYAHPQVASVGLTEAAAIEAHGQDALNIGKFPLLANGKALALGDSEGFIKTIYHKKTGELIGAHLIGNEVTEIISALLVAKTSELTEFDLLNTIFPHPTISESLHEATLSAIGKGLHF